MAEFITRISSLIGQAIEDLTYEPLSLNRFYVEIVDLKKSPQYRSGGFFIFSDLPNGNYDIQVKGDGLQPQEFAVTFPFAPLVFEQAGDNELIVIVKSVSDNGSPDKKITFDPLILEKEIRAGAAVLAEGYAGNLSEDLDIGRHMQVKLNSVVGLSEGNIVRIIRDKSIRMKFNPYHIFTSEITQVTGKVTLKDHPQKTMSGVKIQLAGVGEEDVILHNIAGAAIATVQTLFVQELGSPPGLSMRNIVLGVEKDIVTYTNSKGDYHLYFRKEQLAHSVTIELSFPEYQTLTETVAIIEGRRNQANFEIFKI